MATKSYIGIATGEIVRYIYVYYDGYPAARMEVLKNYQSTDKINELIALGDCISVHEKIENCKPYEAKIESTKIMSKKEFETLKEIGIDFCYLFENNKWRYWAL